VLLPSHTPVEKASSTKGAKAVTKPLFRVGLAMCLASRRYSAFLAQR
jgi:hypothetical protein